MKTRGSFGTRGKRVPNIAGLILWETVWAQFPDVKNFNALHMPFLHDYTVGCSLSHNNPVSYVGQYSCEEMLQGVINHSFGTRNFVLLCCQQYSRINFGDSVLVQLGVHMCLLLCARKNSFKPLRGPWTSAHVICSKCTCSRSLLIRRSSSLGTE